MVWFFKIIFDEFLSAGQTITSVFSCCSVNWDIFELFSKNLFLVGSLLGFDKEHNVISLQTVGRLDVRGMMLCMRNSDLYVLRIAESEGCMNLIR